MASPEVTQLQMPNVLFAATLAALVYRPAHESKLHIGFGVKLASHNRCRCGTTAITTTRVPRAG